MGCSRTTRSYLVLRARSNNTNKWDAQELTKECAMQLERSNNTNKWDAQEPNLVHHIEHFDQIIPINGMLKNECG